MKRLLGMGLLVGLLAPLTSCGWYTNVPAQIQVKSIEPSAVTVTYKETDSGAKAAYDATVTDAVLTLSGQPGSIGVSYRNARVDYFAPGSESAVISRSFPIDLRVPPSVYREDPRKDELGTGTWQDGKLIIGTGQLTLSMFVDREIIQYGFGSGSKMLYALVTFTGEDDAKFPQSLEVSVPIVFTGYAQ